MFIQIIKNKNNCRQIIFLILAVFFILTPKCSAQIVINEVMYDLPGADDKHEWIELFNAGSSEIDLTGWKFNDGDSATNHALNAPPKNGSRGSLVLRVGGYLLLAGDAATVATDLPGFSGSIIDTVMSLANSSATLKIINKDEQEVCSAFYSKEIGAGGNGKTLEWDEAQLKESLAEGGTPGASNSILNPNYSPAPTATPSPTPAGSAETTTPVPSTNQTISPVPEYQYSKEIFINEFLPSPQSGEKEWVEIYNAGAESINLTGWSIADKENIDRPQLIPDGTIIEPKNFLVILLNKQILSNDGDQLNLLWPDNQVLHAVSYQKAVAGQAVARLDSGQWIWTNRPTPGKINLPPLFETTVSENEAAPPPAIAALQETAGQAALAKSPAAANLTKTTKTQTPAASPEAERTIAGNELAAASQSQTKNTNQNTIFILLGVLFSSALAAVGLIFFRRKTQVDSKKSNDNII